MVYLIGAGPGDMGLLTLKAAECIKSADVIIHDRLSSVSILSLAKDSAEFVYVGKAPGRHHKTQEEINALLIEYALRGLTVARVKGGDPFVFGRGGEEALTLREHKIPFEIVPGVTSAVAAPAYGGIPVTHRGYADSFHVITGHQKDGAREPDFKTLAALNGTLVFLMGVSNLPHIVESLIKYGKDPRTPAAIIQQGTTCRQRKAAGVLGNLCEIAEREGIVSPAVIVIGRVAALQDKLDWFGSRPLHSKRIAVTRAREQASGLTGRLTALGAEVFEFPLIKILPDHKAAGAAVLCRPEALVFTSANAVKIYFDAMAENGPDIRELAGVPIFAVGPATRDSLKARGLICEALPQKFSGKDLAEHMLGCVPPGSLVQIVRSDLSAGTAEELLKQHGYEVRDFTIYRTVCDARGAEEFLRLDAEGEIDYVTFTSSSTVRNFVSAAGTAHPRAKAVCIGDATAETARQCGMEVFAVADEATLDGLVKKILEISQAVSEPDGSGADNA